MLMVGRTLRSWAEDDVMVAERRRLRPVSTAAVAYSSCSRWCVRGVTDGRCLVAARFNRSSMQVRATVTPNNHWAAAPRKFPATTDHSHARRFCLVRRRHVKKWGRARVLECCDAGLM